MRQSRGQTSLSGKCPNEREGVVADLILNVPCPKVQSKYSMLPSQNRIFSLGSRRSFVISTILAHRMTRKVERLDFHSRNNGTMDSAQLISAARNLERQNFRAFL